MNTTLGTALEAPGFSNATTSTLTPPNSNTTYSVNGYIYADILMIMASLFESLGTFTVDNLAFNIDSIVEQNLKNRTGNADLLNAIYWNIGLASDDVNGQVISYSFFATQTLMNNIAISLTNM
jgi:hypothetical protein